MKAAVIDAPQSLGVCETIPTPELPPGGALIRVTGCGLCGSDVDKLIHRNFPTGTILGHEVVGEIETLSRQAQMDFPTFQPRIRVVVAHHIPCRTCYYCLHQAPSMCAAFKESNIIPGGFSEQIAVSHNHLSHTVFPIPDGVSDEAASCVEPLACCIRAVHRLPATAGKTVALFGLGFIGLLTAQYLRLKGYTVFGLDLSSERVQLAKTQAMVEDATTDPIEFQRLLERHTDGRGADIVFLSVVTPQTLETAFQRVRDGGTLMLFSASGTPQPMVDQNAIYYREITVLSSYSPGLEQLREAADLVFNTQIQTEPLITTFSGLESLPQALSRYRSGQILKGFIAL